MALLPQWRHKGCNNDNQFGLIECFMSLSDWLTFEYLQVLFLVFGCVVEAKIMFSFWKVSDTFLVDHYKDLTKTDNSAWKFSGTQGNSF